MIKSRFTKEWVSNHMNDLFAYSGFIICLLIFSIFPPITRGINILDPGGLAFHSIISEGVICSILACGAVFVYSLGAMDISVGAQMSLYAMILMRMYNASGSQPAFIVAGILVITAIAMLCGAVNSVIATTLNMKPIITSLILQFFIYGITLVTLNIWSPLSEAYSFDIGTASRTHFAVFRNSWVQLAILVGVVVLFTYLFNYTKLGKNAKAIGANPVFAKQIGINVGKYRMLAYMAFGIAIVIASLIFVSVNGSVTSTAGKGHEMKIMISLIIGGMPLSGGMKSKISSAVLGGFTYALITRCFVFLGVPDRLTSMFVALVYIIVVLLTCRSKERVLPR